MIYAISGKWFNVAATNPSSGNSGQAKPPRRGGQLRAEIQAKVQDLKEKLEEMCNLFYTVNEQEITKLNISTFQSDIGTMIQEVRNLEREPDAQIFFNTIDQFKDLLMVIRARLATQYELYDVPKRTKKQFDEFFNSYNEIVKLISDALKLIK